MNKKELEEIMACISFFEQEAKAFRAIIENKPKIEEYEEIIFSLYDKAEKYEQMAQYAEKRMIEMGEKKK